MAIGMSNNVSLVVNSVDLSVNVREISVTQDADDLDATGMGATSKTHIPGLRDDRVEVTFLADWAAAKVDATLSPLIGSATGFPLVIKPVATTVSATNPSYTMTACLFNYQPIDASVGEISMPKVTFLPAPGSSIVRATT